MRFVPPRPVFGIVAVLITVVAVGVMVNAQPAAQPKPAAAPAQPKPATEAATAKPAPLTEQQQRDAIWNSPEMLRARAWVTDYCTNSKNMSPEECKEYMTELENLSAKQMKLWLLQYEHQQELYVQKESAQQVAHRAAMAHAAAASPGAQQMWEMQHRAGLAQALAANRATQRAYGAIESEETQAAGEEQGQLNAQEAASRQMQMNKQAELNNPYPIYGYGGGYGGPWGYGGGDYHFHFH